MQPDIQEERHRCWIEAESQLSIEQNRYAIAFQGYSIAIFCLKHCPSGTTPYFNTLTPYQDSSYNTQHAKAYSFLSIHSPQDFPISAF